jgi:arginase family enzyme
VRTQAVVFPFDLFGSGGTAAGAQLLCDALREMIDDTKEEPRPVRQKSFVDSLEIEEVSFDTSAAMADWRSLGQRTAKKALAADFVLWLSGNHLGCLPLLETLGDETLIVQFDAHLDCYDLHDTHETLSHGNFLRHAKGLPPIINLGHRDLFLTGKEIRKHFVEAHSAERISIDEAKTIAALRKKVAKAKSIWIDMDVDVFDPPICTAVHSPAPFGLTGLQMLKLIDAIGFDKLRGVSISEFDPGRDVRDASLNLLGWLLEWLLLKRHEPRR